ncbi:MAG: hypothetical protein ACREXY_29195, partial [Gammaproteobacteria bacterium]
MPRNDTIRGSAQNYSPALDGTPAESRQGGATSGRPSWAAQPPMHLPGHPVCFIEHRFQRVRLIDQRRLGVRQVAVVRGLGVLPELLYHLHQVQRAFRVECE